MYNRIIWMLISIISEVMNQLKKEGKVDTSSKNPEAQLKLPLRSFIKAYTIGILWEVLEMLAKLHLLVL